MARAIQIIGRFINAKKPGQAAVLPDGRQLVAPPGQNLMDVALMPHVPDQLVSGMS